MLCPSCAEKIKAHIKPKTLMFECEPGNLISHSFLFEWSKGQSDLLSIYFRQLKGAHRELEWLLLASLCLKLLGPQDFGSRSFFVAVPSHTGDRDHAGFFARGLAQLSGGTPVLDLLVSENNFSQKKKKKSEREVQSFRMNKSSTDVRVLNRDFTANCQLILVDDILTTGGTLRALAKSLTALGFRPEQMRIITLATRARSCGF